MVSSITPIQGNLGIITDRTNLLSYSITTDGTMSTITEKVNGVTIGTKTATSGESLIAGLTQAQWDAVRFGKYADATGGKNTLTVEMGTEKWTYTFDKRPANDADILSAVKAVKDSQEVFLPAVKSKLADAVNSKGGSVSGSDEWDALVNAVGGIPLGKKWASGTITSGASTISFTKESGVTSLSNYVSFDMSNLNFTPRIIEFTRSDKASAYGVFVWHFENHYVSGSNYANSTYGNSSSAFRVPYINGVVNIPVLWGVSYDWIAYE